MNKDIKLYIADKLVDNSDELSLPITFQLEDFGNPTIVKNSFSKTITIPGTKNNNKIFGEIYKLDRMQHYDEWYTNLSGIDFDPSKRVDFKIYKDAELMESGYMQLNDISIQENNISYNITLYGGIGDFFYGLKYNEDGTEKTLADIRYFIEDENGNVLDEKDEMNFEVNKEFVDECFSKDFNIEGNKLSDTITFIPAYNGIYEDFDSSKCLINTNGLTSDIFPTSKTEDDVTYTTVDGFGLANLENSYTEWEMRDLRSYYQRPAIKVSKLIKSICREENSGYDVTFDPAFFNANNPYWSKTFVALPLLTSNDNTTEEEISGLNNIYQLDADSYKYAEVSPEDKRKKAKGAIGIHLANTSVDNDGVITINDWTETTKLNLKLSFRMWAHLNNTPSSGLSYDPMNISFGRLSSSGGFRYSQQFSNYLTVVDADTDEVLGYSTVEEFDDPYWAQYSQLVKPFEGATVNRRLGNLKRSDRMTYYFNTNEDTNEFSLKISNCPVSRRIKIYLNTDVLVLSSYVSLMNNDFYVSGGTSSEGSMTARYWGENVLTSGEAKLIDSAASESNYMFDKKTVLKTEKTPADFLLDYTKLFGLYYIKDVYSKSIFITNRNNFFTGEIVNWSDRIDYLKNVTVTPILFDKKFYMMQLDTPETKDALRYQSQYTQQYGQQRLSTGYNFNYDTKNFYSDNLYQQIVPVIDSDRLFRNFYDSEGHPVPAWLVDNATYELFNMDDSISIDLYGRNIVSDIVEWNGKGMDVWPKSAFFSLDSNEKNLVEIESALLMWNGIKPMTDSNGVPIDFWITDNLGTMEVLNEDPCYIYTESEYDTNNNRIAIKTNRLPQYLNCIVDSGNNVAASLDFGLPKEVYMGNVAYDEFVTIYANFWKAFYNDQFNINTKKVTCFVKLDEMNQSYLRRFYFFDNRIWILNKVDSYDVNSDSTVRCEFIAVWDTSNYTAGQISY